MPGAALTSVPFTVMESSPDINWQHLQFFLKHGRVLPYLLPTAKFLTLTSWLARLAPVLLTNCMILGFLEGVDVGDGLTSLDSLKLLVLLRSHSLSIYLYRRFGCQSGERVPREPYKPQTSPTTGFEGNRLNCALG